MRKQLLQKGRPLQKPEPSFWILLGILAFSFFLNFWNISQNGTCNEYYAACVKSMTQSWHNFFFVSFDPAGMVSVDKPPVGLWMQALSCKVFGYSGWAMLLPQALSGTLSCLLIYLLTAKYFSKPTGLAAALIFAVTPAVVLVSRNSTMDMQLIFWLLLAVWFLMKSIDTGKWRWLIVCGVLIGVGFNVKMLQAYLIVPAVVATYLIFAKGKVWKRFAAGLLAAVVMIGVSFAWIAAVDLTPASKRPYVDSTNGNSAMELVFGHNGVERLVGQGGSMGGNFGGKGNTEMLSGEAPTGTPPQMNGQTTSGSDATTKATDKSSESTTSAAGNTVSVSSSSNITSSKNTASTAGTSSASTSNDIRRGKDGNFGSMQQNGSDGKQGGGGGMNGIGTASPFRLWNDSLYGQACWLLLFAIASCVLCLRKKALKEKNPGQRSLVFWGMWLLVAGGFFSFAGFFHAYYLCMLAPPIAVLSGVGLVELFRFFAKHRQTVKTLPENTAIPLPETTNSETLQTSSAQADTPAEVKKAKIKFKNVRPWLLLAAFFANIAISFVYVLNYPTVSGWLAPLILVPCAAGIALLAVYLRSSKQVMFRIAAVLLAVSLLAGSAYWAWTPVQTPPNATIPTAGPNSSEKGGMGGQMPGNMQGGSGNGMNGQVPNANTASGSTNGSTNGQAPDNGQAPNGSTASGSTNGSTNGQAPDNGQAPNGSTASGSTNRQQGGFDSSTAPSGGGQGGSADSGLETYLKKHYTEGSFLLTSCRASSVAQMIIDTGLPCYAYGGFLGSDNSLTVDKLKELVAEGKVTYFLLSEQGGANSSSGLTSYVEQNATKIDSSEYSSSSTSGHSEGTLYLFSK